MLKKVFSPGQPPSAHFSCPTPRAGHHSTFFPVSQAGAGPLGVPQLFHPLVHTPLPASDRGGAGTPDQGVGSLPTPPPPHFPRPAVPREASPDARVLVLLLKNRKLLVGCPHSNLDKTGLNQCPPTNHNPLRRAKTQPPETLTLTQKPHQNTTSLGSDSEWRQAQETTDRTHFQEGPAARGLAHVFPRHPARPARTHLHTLAGAAELPHQALSNTSRPRG